MAINPFEGLSLTQRELLAENLERLSQNRDDGSEGSRRGVSTKGFPPIGKSTSMFKRAEGIDPEMAKALLAFRYSKGGPLGRLTKLQDRFADSRFNPDDLKISRPSNPRSGRNMGRAVGGNIGGGFGGGAFGGRPTLNALSGVSGPRGVVNQMGSVNSLSGSPQEEALFELELERMKQLMQAKAEAEAQASREQFAARKQFLQELMGMLGGQFNDTKTQKTNSNTTSEQIFNMAGAPIRVPLTSQTNASSSSSGSRLDSLLKLMGAV